MRKQRHRCDFSAGADTFRFGLLGTASVLALGTVASGIGLVLARRHGVGSEVLWLGLLTGTLLFASMLCLFLKLARFLEGRKLNQQSAPDFLRINGDAEYMAEYSLQNRSVAIALAVFFGVVTVFLVLRSAKVVALGLCSLLFCWSVYYAIHVIVTRVRFTRDRVVARLPWFRRVSQPYGNVLRLHFKPGTVDLRFSDGRSLKMHSGLGDPEVILAYLHKHCPPSVCSNGESGQNR